MGKVSELCIEKLTPEVEKLGYKLVEVEYAKKFDGMNLTLFIDCEKGIGLDDCEKVHKLVDKLLDELDPTENKPYILNVSSLGWMDAKQKERLENKETKKND